MPVTVCPSPSCKQIRFSHPRCREELRRVLRQSPLYPVGRDQSCPCRCLREDDEPFREGRGHHPAEGRQPRIEPSPPFILPHFVILCSV